MAEKDEDPKVELSRYWRQAKIPRLKGPVSRIRPVKPIRLRRTPFVLRRRGIRLPSDRRAWLERRAVPRVQVYGTLSERIVYRAFQQHGFDFDFQTSLLGGRQILGGRVADFILWLPYGPVIVRVQSYAFHSGVDARRKDEEDKRILETLIDPCTQKNYVVYDLWEDVIFDPERLEEWIDRYLLGNYQGQGVRAPWAKVSWMPNKKEWEESLAEIDSLKIRVGDLAEQVGYLIISMGGPQPGADFIIDTLNIRDLAVTDAKINSLTVDKLTAGTIQAGEYIKAGSGTKDDDLTGFIIDSTELVGQNSGTDQVVLSASTGKLTAGAGAVTLDADGITLIQGTGTANLVKWETSSGTSIGYVEISAGATVSSMTAYVQGEDGTDDGAIYIRAVSNDNNYAQIEVHSDLGILLYANNVGTKQEVAIQNATDLKIYSDDQTTLKASIDGATGNIDTAGNVTTDTINEHTADTGVTIDTVLIKDGSVDGVDVSAHASRHTGATDEIDGDQVDIDFTPTNYTPDATPAEAADVDDLTAHLKGIDTAVGAAGGTGEGHITILGPDYNSIGQGTWAIFLSASQWFYGWWRNTSSADGDNISYEVTLEAGTYTLALLCVKAVNHGILDIDIDDTEVASFDLYAAASAYNVYNSQADISISSAGLKTLKLRVHGKNDNSTDYWVGYSYIALWRTA